MTAKRKTVAKRRAPSPKRSETPAAAKAASRAKVAESAPQMKSRSWRALKITLVAIIGPVVAAFVGYTIYMTGGRFASTDNAYVKSEKIAVSADVSGRVVHVAVKENQLLEPGMLLFRIDPEPFRIALEKAEARLVFARQEIYALRAQHKQKLAELKLAEGEVTFYERLFERQQTLNKKGFASGTNFDTAQRNLRNARNHISATMQDIAQVVAKLGGDPNSDTEAQPRVREARAARDQAALDLRRTSVHAPVAGVVTNFELQPGEYIETGKVVFSLVGTDDLWVDANFKETDLTHVQVGQTATIRIDTYPGDVREAVVSGISPATGAEFALLPAQNASGNWVKVVQRLPVRLRLKSPRREPQLRAGMSVIVTIDTQHKRRLPDFAKAALNWARNLI